MAKAKPRQVRVEQKSALAHMEQLAEHSDEELERETKFKAAALAILGSRAAERYDAKAARDYFRRAITAARPQERMQLRRMADASLALAERRPDDLKAAVERLGQEAPTKRQLLALRFMGLIAPAPGSGAGPKIRAAAVVLGIVLVLLLLGLAVVQLLSLPFGGGLGIGEGLVLGLIVVIIALAVLFVVGRRRQAAALAKRREAGAGRGGGGKARKP